MNEIGRRKGRGKGKGEERGEGEGERRERRREESSHPMKQLFTLVHLVQDLVTPHVLEYQSNIRLEPQ